MSKFVTELIQDLKNNPTDFTDYFGMGVKKKDLVITDYGNTRLLSIIQVEINSKRIPLSYIDRWRLEGAVRKWYKTVSLNHLMK
jgi:hypothetical protein